MQLTFLGAARTVTGSKYLIEYNNKKILIDCGLFQGHKEARLLNWQKFPISPKTIDAIILTHAHIDHTGYIPRLIKDGFRGKIFASSATTDLCKILLPDSGFLQEEDAYQANHYGYSKHKPALPLYNEKEAIEALKYFHNIEFGSPCYLDKDFYFTLSRSGHILGSSFISLFAGNKSIVFSGDLGRLSDPIMKSPAHIQNADYLLIESTYGDRLHSTADPIEQIGELIKKTAARGGNIIIPAFAVGRAQSILYYLYMLKKNKTIPDLPIFLDSPMAISASDLLSIHRNEHKLPPQLCHDVCAIATYVRTADESKKLNGLKPSAIIISASGMASGGRVLHHLTNNVSNEKNTILFTGYQVEGTRGNKMVNGEKEITIYGTSYPVKAEIINLSNTSAHADYNEILTWLGNFRKAPIKTFITHGSVAAAQSLQQKITEQLKWKTNIPEYLQSETL